MSTVMERRDGRANRPPPTAHYASAWELEAAAEGRPGFEKKRENTASPLTWFVVSVCLGLWALVGLAFWLPILMREVVWFSVALGRSMLTGTRPTDAGKALREAVGFYFRGFRVAVRAIVGRTEAEEEEEDQKPKPPLKGRVALEVLWAVLVWYVALFATGVVQATPVDAWEAAVSWPWSQWFDTVAGWFPVVGGS
jgi:hypothetical protein